MSHCRNPRPNRRAGASRDLLAEWEANAFSVNRRHRAIAAHTIVDDTLPEEPWKHPAETRAALELLVRR